MRFGAVVLTTGGRPAELSAALDSIRSQRDVDVRTVVVLNGDKPADSTEGPTDGGMAADGGVGADSGVAGTVEVAGEVEVVRPGRNLGIPGGRNLGMERLGDDVDAVLFLDDDAVVAADDVLLQVADAFAEDPQLAVVTMRLIDPVTGRTERRHVPRVRVGDPSRSSWVTTFLGGACVIRADAYRRAGGLPEAFFYAHEETSLAWRLLDDGWRLQYRGDLEVFHPAASPARHADYHRLTARNRFLLAHLHLPLPVAAVYVGVWTTLALARGRGGRRAILAGLREGWGMRDMSRQPIRWRTMLRMTRYGRPPII